jgi:hypothetical protein
MVILSESRKTNGYYVATVLYGFHCPDGAIEPRVHGFESNHSQGKARQDAEAWIRQHFGEWETPIPFTAG